MTHEEALKPIDSALWELGEALEGLQDADLWVRAHPRLLSAGELLAHIGFGEMRWIKADLESPLAMGKANYYLDMVGAPFALEFGVESLYAELKRIHEACKAFILETRPDLSAVSPYREDWTWGYTLEYTAFHIAYHTGQIYSVRHLMGHETANN